MPKKAIRPIEEGNTLKLFSKNAIGAFAILFSTLFGALLLMHNLRSLNKKAASIRVFAFGVFYTLASIGVLEIIVNSSNLAILLNLIGAGMLTTIFWNRYIGKTIEFTARHWSKPAMILVSCLVFVLLVYVYRLQILAGIGI